MGIRVSIVLMIVAVVVLGVMRSDIRVAGIGRKQTQIDFWNGFTGPDGMTMLELIREFNKQNPDVRASMQRMAWDTYYNKLMVASVDGRGPELFVVHASTLPRMARAGFIDWATNLMQKDAIPPDDFDPYVLQQVKYGNEFIGVPLDIHPQGLYCNADMLKEAGFVDAKGEPRAPVDKEEFLYLVKKLRKFDRNRNPEVWGFALTMWRNNFQSLVPQFGGRYLDENGNADLDNPGNVAALEFLGSLSKEHLVPPPDNGLGWVGYRQKKVAMVWDGVYMLGDILRLQDLNYLGAPIPRIGPKPGTMADSHVLCLRKGISKEKREAAERFIKFLSANSARWAAAGQVAARRSVRESEAFKKLKLQSAFAKQIPYMMYPPRTPVLFELTLEIDLAVEKVMRGRATAAEALKVASANAQKAIERDRRERGGTP